LAGSFANEPKSTDVTRRSSLASSGVDADLEQPDNQFMALLRAFLAALIALSVAMLPVEGPAAAATQVAEMAMSADGADPCCPCCHDHNNDQSKSLVTCAIKCGSAAATVFPAMLPLRHDTSWQRFSLASGNLSELLRSPPTHPPPA
jgi:hypothetical protein